MKLFKNEVGRPSNETLRKRRNFILMCIGFVVLLIGGVALLVRNNDVSNFSGAIGKTMFKYNNKRACVAGTGLDGKKYNCDKEYSQTVNLTSSKIKLTQNKFTNYGYNLDGLAFGSLHNSYYTNGTKNVVLNTVVNFGTIY